MPTRERSSSSRSCCSSASLALLLLPPALPGAPEALAEPLFEPLVASAAVAAFLAAAAARSAAFLAFLPTGPPLLPEGCRMQKAGGNDAWGVYSRSSGRGGTAGCGSGCQQSAPAAAKPPTQQWQHGASAHAGRGHCSCDRWGRRGLESKQVAAGRQLQLVGTGAPPSRRRRWGQPNSSMRNSPPGPTCAPPSLLADARTNAGRLVARRLQTLWAAAGRAPTTRCSCIAPDSWPVLTAVTVGVVWQSTRHGRVSPHGPAKRLLLCRWQHARAKCCLFVAGPSATALVGDARKWAGGARPPVVPTPKLSRHGQAPQRDMMGARCGPSSAWLEASSQAAPEELKRSMLCTKGIPNLLEQERKSDGLPRPGAD